MQKQFGLIMICTLILSSLAFSDEQKIFTIKGLYALKSAFVANVSDSDYAKTGKKGAYDLTYDMDAGFGLGAEMKLTEIKIAKKDIELIGGYSYMVARKIPQVNGKGKLDGQTVITYKDVEADNSYININSIYTKARYIFMVKENDPRFYVSGKIAYNMISLTGDLKDLAKIDNGIGAGLSIGCILDDEWDMELAMDNIGATMKADDGIDDNLKGTYSIANTSLSLGYRF